MQKRRPPKKTSHAPPRWRTRRIGSGITEKVYPWLPIDVYLKLQPDEREKLLAKFPAAKDEHFGYDKSIARARSILEKAGLPTDPGRMHPRPKGGMCTLLDLVEQRGKKELDAPEWFAAKILTCWHEALTARLALQNPHLREKKREFHLSQLLRHMGELGNFAATAKMKFRWEEKVLKHRRLGEGGSKGGGHAKRRLGIEQAIRDRLAKSPRLSAHALWGQFMHEEIIRIGEYTIEAIDADKGTKDQKLVEEGGPRDSVKYLKFRAFRNYVSRLKKEDK